MFRKKKEVVEFSVFAQGANYIFHKGLELLLICYFYPERIEYPENVQQLWSSLNLLDEFKQYYKLPPEDVVYRLFADRAKFDLESVSHHVQRQHGTVDISTKELGELVDKYTSWMVSNYCDVAPRLNYDVVKSKVDSWIREK